MCLYYDISYSNCIGEKGDKDLIKLSSFIIYSNNTNDNDYSQSQPQLYYNTKSIHNCNTTNSSATN